MTDDLTQKKYILERIIHDIYLKCFNFNNKNDMKFVQMNVGLENLINIEAQDKES